jgi:hypothetical protein
MALMYANVKITGTKPLLFHSFSTETLSLERRERTGVLVMTQKNGNVLIQLMKMVNYMLPHHIFLVV